MTDIKVTQKPGKEVPLDVLACAIKDISEGIKTLNTSRLNERALLLLIRETSGVSYRDIKAVIAGINELEAAFIKPSPRKA